jgi:hypothetical protein
MPGAPPSREVGLAGEHYVAMMLAMVGVTPAVLPAGTPDADVIATLHGRACSIQVKTMGAAGRSVVDMKPERILRSDFVVIVALNMPGQYRATSGTPTAYVLPREVMAEAWKAGGYEHPKRPGLRLTSEVRAILEDHREAWNLVADALDVGLPPRPWPTEAAE